MIARKATPVVAVATMPRSLTPRGRHCAHGWGAQPFGTGPCARSAALLGLRMEPPCAAPRALHPIPQGRCRGHAGSFRDALRRMRSRKTIGASGARIMNVHHGRPSWTQLADAARTPFQHRGRRAPAAGVSRGRGQCPIQVAPPAPAQPAGRHLGGSSPAVQAGGDEQAASQAAQASHAGFGVHAHGHAPPAEAGAGKAGPGGKRQRDRAGPVLAHHSVQRGRPAASQPQRRAHVRGQQQEGPAPALEPLQPA